MNKYVVIVAAGKGERMGTDLPKQYIMLKDKPVVLHTIEKFRSVYPKIKVVLVISRDHEQLWKSFKERFDIFVDYVTYGGDTRFESVKNGLKLVPDNALVAIHDAARPIVSKETILRCFETAEKSETALPVFFVNESFRVVENDKSSVIDRNKLRIVQTPQTFKSTLLKKAYNCEYKPEFTDSASVVENSGVTINLVEGNVENIKITRSIDLKVAEIIIENELS